MCLVNRFDLPNDGMGALQFNEYLMCNFNSFIQRECEQYWAENMGEVYNTPDKMFSVTTTSLMPFADFVIRTFSVKHVS